MSAPSNIYMDALLSLEKSTAPLILPPSSWNAIIGLFASASVIAVLSQRLPLLSVTTSASGLILRIIFPSSSYFLTTVYCSSLRSPSKSSSSTWLSYSDACPSLSGERLFSTAYTVSPSI